MTYPQCLSLGLALAVILGTPQVLRSQEAPKPVSPAELSALSAGVERELKDDILPFWLKYTRNPANGGYYGVIEADMTIKKGAPRGALLTSRILWTFSKAYRTYHDPAYLEMANWAYHDLVDHFIDRESGGIFWTISEDGRPLGAFKQIYGQAFGIYALAEYNMATGNKEALDHAVAIYRLIEANARDKVNGGYFDVMSRHWKRPGVGEKNLLGDAPKSQNSHIHILEAYTNLLRAWPDPGLLANQHELIEVTIRHIIDPRTHHLILFMKDDWTPVSDEVSYGHDIELSWLLVEAASVVGDPELVKRVKPISLAIAKATLSEGVDPDGGVLNEGSPSGYVNTGKDWWPQAEAEVGFLNAYQLSGDPMYFKASAHSWEFIQKRMLDRVHGDWFETVNRDGSAVPTAKVTLWKCPYHTGRSCFELVERIRELNASP
ncbi:MAG TPA: AGE family epimerase/isomerase [Opitutaceae bacterium]|jgi:mannobiose 2-epimerase|nr:AGE family epimerase/isomerase [Opitutaceae bacterium]